ncbi:hypothetical protein C5167_027679 [Papaver somniferum]|uniref:uncharacterized protein At1g01500-like n=1 Tax=Papaver somniferum TaxID=3469 RepID=UPI000E6FDFAE|nr:uncharacterized protein At1g01500-like [Papaver somniferum]RZC91614.1 hypothetical protein C5167_027679 [Papaver somniferum]
MEVENYPTRDHHHHHPHHLSHLNIHHHHKIISSSSTKDLTFEIKVTYMRIISLTITNLMKKTSSTSSSSSMNLVFLPRDLHTCLQINGLTINPSEKISRPLNKHRSDSLMSELMYVNTDRIKFKGFSLPFEIVLQHQDASSSSSSGSVLVSGSLRRKVSGMKDDCMWVMECKELSHDSKLTSGGGSVDVYFAGRSLGKPLLLNGLIELKKSHKGVDFLEDENEDGGGELGLLDTTKEKEGAIQEFVDSHKYNNKHHDQNHYGEEEKFVVEEEEEEVSWFNEGVRVGIGLGMGMCLGVGVGLGLVVKTYKKTSGSFIKFLFKG